MKKFLRVVLALVTLLVIGAVAAAMLVDINSFKPQIIAQAEKALGRTVTMEGDISLRILPTIAIKTGKVTISNPEWAGGGNMLSAESISLGAELMPLLDKRLNVTSFEIQKPVLLLVKKGSQANWNFAEENSERATDDKKSAAPEGQKLSLSVKHVFFGSGDLTFKDLATGSVQRLQDFNLKVTAPNKGEKISLESDAKLNGQELKFKAVVSSPERLITGDVTELETSVALGKLSGVYKGTVQLGKVPTLKGSLNAGEMDLNGFGSGEKSGGPAALGGQGAWSDAPIDFSGLKAVNADLDVSIDALTFKKTTIKPLKTKLTLHDGVLNFVIRTTLYGGVTHANVAVRSEGAVKLSADVEQVQAEPFLADWANNDSISGTLNADFHLNMVGKSQRAMVSTLGGNAKFAFRDGAIKGKNLAANIRRLRSLGAVAEGGPQQTDFSEITGTATINQGILRNDDLFMKSPLIRLKGAGEVNLPSYQLTYTLKPEIVGTLKGQGGKDDAAGLVVPLKISGNLNSPTYAIDTKAALMENLTPEKIDAVKNNVKALKEQYKNGGGIKGLKGLLGR